MRINLYNPLLRQDSLGAQLTDPMMLALLNAEIMRQATLISYFNDLASGRG